MSRLVRTSSNNTDFCQLVSLLDAELRVRYGIIQDLYEPHNKIGEINTVVIAYTDAEPAGCGCFKKHDEQTIEIKRMFVAEDYRGRGISKLILKELELWAKELGYKRTVLETGLKQPESLALYKKFGYKQIPNYEPYMDMVESLCFCKEL